MKSIAMLLSNPFRPDPRVLKEAETLAGQGYNITILAWDRAGEMAPTEHPSPHLKIHRIQHVESGYGLGAIQLKRLPRFWSECFSLLEQIKPNLVHCHDFDTLPAGLAWGKLHHTPVVYDAHEYYAQLVKTRLSGISGSAIYHIVRLSEQLGARIADAVITVDEPLANIYRRLNNKVLIVGHFPPKTFAAQPSCAFSNQSLDLIYAGRLSHDRGLRVYADLLRQLRMMGIPARLILAGVFTPASEEREFFTYTADIQEHIENLGWVEFTDMPETLRKADIGLALLLPEPRYFAALPVKLFEYMAAGLPVIASNFPAITKVIQDARCGLVFDPLSDPSSIANKIAYWWRNPDQAQMAGEAGRQAVLERYNFELLAEAIGFLYQELLST